MKLFALLKPPPHLLEIENADDVKERYRYWRLRIFCGMYIGYIFYYFTRKSFTFAMPGLMTDLGFDKGQLGILTSILAISYGVSKFLSGMLADRSNPRFFMGIGLILTGIFNICFGFASSIGLFALFWGLNGWFQGWGWPPCARLLTHWYAQNERGRWWGVWNTSHSVGGALIPLVAAFCVESWGWRYAMYIPGCLCIAMGVFVINRLRDTPQSLGLPPIEKFRNGTTTPSPKEEHELSIKSILWEYILSNSYIWVLAISYFFVYIIRTAVNDWSVLFLVETKGYSLMKAGGCVFWFEVGGILGSLASGWASDRIFKGRRAPVNVLCALAVVSVLYAFWVWSGESVFIDSGLMFLLGFLIFGPQMLIGIAAAELSHKKAAATATGFVGCLAYLGAACAGYPLGRMTQELGWAAFFCVLALCGVISALLLIPLWKIKVHPRYTQQPEKGGEAMRS